MDEDLHQGMGRPVQALLSFAKLWGRNVKDSIELFKATRVLCFTF